ncbi:hypothetical protein HPB50_018801 [Hyalomma asiaticum]|uniref:Uncharacterized protein n=1 Tax=Hyalomma asiaticum TaxID=266040 RepID=A0ACB7RIS2_HYAAI|nr:hypothetical protein HPB50_018801 [Hyalomma asiaticum]
MDKWAKYARNYKKEWEEEPDFKNWLSPSTSGNMDYCRACKVELRPHVEAFRWSSGGASGIVCGQKTQGAMFRFF